MACRSARRSLSSNTFKNWSAKVTVPSVDCQRHCGCYDKITFSFSFSSMDLEPKIRSNHSISHALWPSSITILRFILVLDWAPWAGRNPIPACFCKFIKLGENLDTSNQLPQSLCFFLSFSHLLLSLTAIHVSACQFDACGADCDVVIFRPSKSSWLKMYDLLS